MQRLNPDEEKPVAVMVRITQKQAEHLDKHSDNRSLYIRELIEQDIFNFKNGSFSKETVSWRLKR